MYNYKIEIISNVALPQQMIDVNAFLLTIKDYRIYKIENYAVGTSPAVRYITTITYRIPS